MDEYAIYIGIVVATALGYLLEWRHGSRAAEERAMIRERLTRLETIVEGLEYSDAEE